MNNDQMFIGLVILSLAVGDIFADVYGWATFGIGMILLGMLSNDD